MTYLTNTPIIAQKRLYDFQWVWSANTRCEMRDARCEIRNTKHEYVPTTLPLVQKLVLFWHYCKDLIYSAGGEPSQPAFQPILLFYQFFAAQLQQHEKSSQTS